MSWSEVKKINSDLNVSLDQMVASKPDTPVQYYVSPDSGTGIKNKIFELNSKALLHTFYGWSNPQPTHAKIVLDDVTLADVDIPSGSNGGLFAIATMDMLTYNGNTGVAAFPTLDIDGITAASSARFQFTTWAHISEDLTGVTEVTQTNASYLWLYQSSILVNHIYIAFTGHVNSKFGLMYTLLE